MSWSINRTGRPAAVAALIAKDLAGFNCHGSEDVIKSKVGEIVAAALAAFPATATSAVKVEGYGSQSARTDGAINSLKLVIEPIFDFVE